jgi:predicted Kef-type K+ transport protein
MALLAGSAVLALKFPVRTAVLVGMAFCQVGECSFILSKMGQGQGLFSGNSYQISLELTIISIVAAPLMMALAPGPQISYSAGRCPKGQKLGGIFRSKLTYQFQKTT